MEVRKSNLASSLPVPSVQDLVKQTLTDVPPRYIRPDQDSPQICKADSASNLPVVDMLKLLSANSMDSELEKLHQACKEWGFFQLINHGVSNSLIEKVKVETQGFFNLPMAEKKKYWQKPENIEGFGQAFVKSEDQKLDWGDLFVLYTLPAHLRNPQLFPNLPLPLRDALDAYSTETKDLALKILDQMAKALKMDHNDLKELFEEGTQIMRMNYYPPCPQPELVMGLNSHSDAAGLTVLLQINDTEGLQIKNHGIWVPVKPVPDAFIVNIGDTLEIVTNGAYRSIEHRATVNSENERLSLATFYSPNLDAEIRPAPSLITEKTPPLFRTVASVDYLKGYLSGELREKSYVDRFKIQNEDANSC